MAMEKKKVSVFWGRILGVEFIDQANGELDEGVGVLVARLADGVGQVSQQGEVEMGIAIGEEADLEIADQFAHLIFVEE